MFDDLAVIQSAVATVSTIVYVALGFLPRPGRAATMWTVALAHGMAASYGWLAAGMTGSAWLSAVAVGLGLGGTAMTWAGARAYLGRARAGAPIALASCGLAIAGLCGSVALDLYAAAFRVAFAAMAVFAALTIVELLRLTGRRHDEALPLVCASALLIVFGLLVVVDGVVQLVDVGPMSLAAGLDFVRRLNALIMILYLFGAVLTFLLLTRRTSPRGAASATSPFRTVVTDRLARAEHADDRWWAVLDVRLDDPTDIREVASTTAFDRVTASFRREVRAVFPAEADIEEQSTTRFLVVVSRPDAAIRHLLAQLLDRVSIAVNDPSIAVRLSASIGWAGVGIVGYGLTDLVAAASEAADRAERAGGDRWERVSVPLTLDAGAGRPPR